MPHRKLVVTIGNKEHPVTVKGESYQEIDRKIGSMKSKLEEFKIKATFFYKNSRTPL
jgi:hypothetical protein